MRNLKLISKTIIIKVKYFSPQKFPETKNIYIKPCRIGYSSQILQYPDKTEMNIFAKTKKYILCTYSLSYRVEIVM